MTQPWVGRLHGNVTHCAHGVSYRELCGFCWEDKPVKNSSPSNPLCVRLRDWNGNSFGPYKSPVSDLLAAADEIDRLTARVAELEAARNQDMADRISALNAAWAERDRLRAALERAVRSPWALKDIVKEALAGAADETSAVRKSKTLFREDPHGRQIVSQFMFDCLEKNGEDMSRYIVEA